MAAISTPLPGFDAAVVLIGASTGGPPVVEQILRALPASFPSPVAVCQHMSAGFVEGWAERLDPRCWLRVKVAEHGERFVRGTVYLAETGRHIAFMGDVREPRIRLLDSYPGALFVPSVDCLFASGAATFGSRAIGVLLTGLGSDGATGLLELRRVGAYTLIERPESAVAASMPESAALLGAAVEAVSASEMPRVILERASGAF